MAFTGNSSSNSSAQAAEINVTPLIDVLLVLLIIFMVIVPVAQRGLESSVPQGPSSAAALPPVTVEVVQRDPALPAQYVIDSHVVPMAELQPTLRALFAARQDRTLFVKGDRSLTYRQVAEVVEQGRIAGAGRIALQEIGNRK